MARLKWEGGTGFVEFNGRRVTLASQPEFSFEYDMLFVDDTVVVVAPLLGLTADQEDEVRAFMLQFAPAAEVVLCHGVDANGDYLGVVAPGAGITDAGAAPPPGPWRWQSGSWVLVVNLDAEKQKLCDEIDRAAGGARVRYITSVPGQEAVYLRKLEQAKAHIIAAATDPNAEAPPYIAAEATATGLTPLNAATAIQQVAALWDDILSPAIEGARIGGKRAVEAATTLSDAQAAASSALATLANI